MCTCGRVWCMHLCMSWDVHSGQGWLSGALLCHAPPYTLRQGTSTEIPASHHHTHLSVSSCALSCTRSRMNEIKADWVKEQSGKELTGATALGSSRLETHSPSSEHSSHHQRPVLGFLAQAFYLPLEAKESIKHTF